MRRKSFWIAASCILAVVGLRPVFSSSASPGSREKVIYAFTGGADGGSPLSDLTIGSAGNLYGTTSHGGIATTCVSCGTVFELKRPNDGWKEQVLYSFAGGNDGAGPAAGVIFDKAGNLYGTTEGGGSGDSGTVFKLTPNSRGGWTETVIYSFAYNGSAGQYPAVDLSFDVQGNIYGTTPQGASNGGCSEWGCGALFELTPRSDGSWTETTIHVFTDTGGDGAIPSSEVVLDSAGNVYGTTKSGGTGSCLLEDHPFDPTLGCGTIYRATQGSGGAWTETVLYNFVRGGGFGVFPSGGVLFDNANHLFGVTLAGGDGLGAAFELRDLQSKGWVANWSPYILWES
jgi:uncharacterized repeat protein (TIGR03803 family)